MTPQDFATYANMLGTQLNLLEQRSRREWKLDDHDNPHRHPAADPPLPIETESWDLINLIEDHLQEIHYTIRTYTPQEGWAAIIKDMTTQPSDYAQSVLADEWAATIDMFTRRARKLTERPVREPPHFILTPAQMADWINTMGGKTVNRKQVAKWLERGSLKAEALADGYWKVAAIDLYEKGMGE